MEARGAARPAATRPTASHVHVRRHRAGGARARVPRRSPSCAEKGVGATMDLGGRSLKGQMKQADRLELAVGRDRRPRRMVARGGRSARHAQPGAGGGGARRSPEGRAAPAGGGRRSEAAAPERSIATPGAARMRRRAAVGDVVRVAGLGPPPPRPRRPRVRRPARPLGPRAGRSSTRSTRPRRTRRPTGCAPSGWCRSSGEVVRRSEETVNPELPTGEVEVRVDRLTVLAEAETPPFPLDEDVPVDEALRLRHRYLDLRREPMQRGARAAPCGHAGDPRVTSTERDFLEIETPILTRSTPEGARDFIVPSRHAARQLLRAAAVAAALQAAPDDRRLRALLPDRALLPRRGPARRPPARVHPARPRDVVRQRGRRDRGHRGDRLPPRSRAAGVEVSSPFPRHRLRRRDRALRHATAPTLRFGLEIRDLGHALRETEFKVFRGVLEGGASCAASTPARTSSRAPSSTA